MHKDHLGTPSASKTWVALQQPAKPQALTISSFFSTTRPKVVGRPSQRAVLRISCSAVEGDSSTSRRELVLHSVNVAVVGALLGLGAGPRPKNLGVQDYGGGVKTYNPAQGRGKKNPASKEEAFKELEEVVSTLKPDNFTPKIVKKTDDYLYVEYESPLLGFVDDVEFWFPPNNPNVVEYRSASRLGESDFDINRKRIKAIREELQKKGWRSLGF
ncbi:hypothetical protein N2152v2_010730 [Parachlorella kessleri]